MQAQKTLIDKASKMCSSDAELCRRAMISPALLSLMRSGKRAMTPTTAAVIASIAGEDPEKMALEAVVESARGTRLENLVREILGKAVAAGVAGMLVFSYSSESTAATLSTNAAAKSPRQDLTAYTSYLFQMVARLGRTIAAAARAGRATLASCAGVRRAVACQG